MELARFLLKEKYLKEESPFPGKGECQGYFFMQKDTLCLVTRNTLSIFTGQDLENFLSIFEMSDKEMKGGKLYFIKAVGVKNDKIELQKIKVPYLLPYIHEKLIRKFGVFPNKESILQEATPVICIPNSLEGLFKHGDCEIIAGLPRSIDEWMRDLANHFYFLEDKERKLIIGTKLPKSKVTVSRIIK